MLETPKAKRTEVMLDAILTSVTIASDVTMGNQQERSLAWFAGMPFDSDSDWSQVPYLESAQQWVRICWSARMLEYPC